MMDFNSSSSIAGQVTALVDAGLQQARARQSERQYLGASRLGVACERALQFEYAKAPIDHPTDLAGLRGARFVTAIETEQGRRLNESKVKAITGGDKISARFMHKDFFEYALASAATRLFVARTGGVGSIGVIAMHVDQSVKDAHDGVRYTAVFAGERKNDLNPHEPISNEAHAVLKAEVDRIYDLFVETVARHRGLDADAVRATEAGLFFGPDAVATGLADAVGSLDDALTQLTQSLSPLPTQVATASQAGFLRNHQMESSMNDRTDPAASDRPLADLAGSPPQPSVASTATATALSVADAVEIAQTCTLAGRTDLIAGFLEAQSSPAQVRSQLLAAQAEASPEITSRIAPDAARPVASNPLIDAAKQIAAQSTKKEI